MSLFLVGRYYFWATTKILLQNLERQAFGPPMSLAVDGLGGHSSLMRFYI